MVRVTTTTESPSELSGEADDDTGVLAGGDGSGMTTILDADETGGFKVGVQSVLRFRWAWPKIKFALVRLLGPFQEASY